MEATKVLIKEDIKQAAGYLDVLNNLTYYGGISIKGN
jgi:hypothetical protein